MESTVRSNSNKFQSKARKALSFILAALFALNTTVSAAVPADSLLSSPLSSEQPTITLEQSTSTTTEQTTSTTSAADSFMSGPLSTATASEAATTGRTLYVSKTGSDTADGSETNPYKTLQKAVDQLVAGDTLIIREGTYNESVDMKVSGTADKYITIRGEGNVIIDGEPLYDYEPVFDTKGFDYLRFENLTVNNARDAVEVGPGSQYVEIDGLHTNNNHFAVKINSATNVTVRNVVAANSRNAFRTENAGGIVPSNILFENIEAYGSKDVYDGYETKYRNGDGFILEAGNNITLRNIKSYDNWDGGMDIKANNVLVENIEVWGNKNNFKIWGSSIVVKNALIRNARYLANDPVAGEGNGVNARTGSVTFINATFVDNDEFDIKVDNDGGPSRVTCQNCVIARKKSGGVIFTNIGGTFTDKNSVWYWEGRSNLGVTPDSSSIVANPKFVNWDTKDFRLQSTSPAIDMGSTAFPISSVDLTNGTRVVGSTVDAGAYEYASVVNPNPSPAPDTTVPVISAVASSNVTTNSAAISWTTNEASDSQVEYRVQGTTTWTATALNASLVTNHSAAINSLLAGTVYEFRVKSKDAAGNLATQAAISTFTTSSVAPSPAPGNDILGVTEGQTLSGTVNIGPNLTKLTGISKVAYYLNGAQSGKVYSAPFYWGGVNGTGVAGMDTKTLANGSYTLGMTYTDGTGDHTVQVSFIVNNGTTPQPTSNAFQEVNGQAVMEAENMLSATTVNGQTWSTVNSATQSGGKILKSGPDTGVNLASNTGARADYKIKIDSPGTYYVWVRGVTTDGNNDSLHVGLNGQLATNGTGVGGNFTPNQSSWSNRNMQGNRVSFTVTQAGEYTLNLWMREDGFAMDKIIVTKNAAFVPTGAGPAESARANTTPTPTDTAAPVISAVTSSNVTTSGATVSWTTDENSDTQVEYRVKGTATWQATAVNASLVKSHTVTLSGLLAGTQYEFRVKSKDQAGNLATQSTISSFTTAIPVLDYVGVLPGQTVSGTVNIGPNLTRLAGVSKVAYYLNGTKSGKVYSSPFYWGGVNGTGTAGFDTRTLANGTYTLALVYTDLLGDHTISISFTVNN